MAKKRIKQKAIEIITNKNTSEFRIERIQTQPSKTPLIAIKIHSQLIKQQQQHRNPTINSISTCIHNKVNKRTSNINQISNIGKVNNQISNSIKINNSIKVNNKICINTSWEYSLSRESSICIINT